MPEIDLLKLTIDAIEDLKGNDITTIDVSEKTHIADHMVIASGTSSRHVKAMAMNLVTEAKLVDRQPIGVEGLDEGDWVLVDLGDVIAHFMLPDVRDFYDLESLWNMYVDKKEAESAGGKPNS